MEKAGGIVFANDVLTNVSGARYFVQEERNVVEEGQHVEGSTILGAGGGHFLGADVMETFLEAQQERDKSKSKRRRDWDPPCDCDVIEIQRPTNKEGPKILKGGNNNRIVFRIQSKSQISKKTDNDDKAQAITYEMGRCSGGPNTNDQCRTFTIYPVMNSSTDAQEVHTDRVTEGNENVFMLKVKKKTDSIEEPKNNIEVEVRTPVPPTPPST